jgi:hypothetical protein
VAQLQALITPSLRQSVRGLRHIKNSTELPGWLALRLHQASAQDQAQACARTAQAMTHTHSLLAQARLFKLSR